jgi:hypothetical protein
VIGHNRLKILFIQSALRYFAGCLGQRKAGALLPGLAPVSKGRRPIGGGMISGSTNLSFEEVEKMLQRFIRFHSPVKLFPVLDSEENLWYFVARTSAAIAAKVNEQQAKDLMKGRHEAAFLRGLSWLDKLLWNELWLYPVDPLVQRTARLLGIISKTYLPRKAKDAHDPRRVALEYDLLFEKFRSVLRRRPATIDARRLPQYREATFGREGAVFLSRFSADIINDQRYKAWTEETLKLGQNEIDIPWWLKGRNFELSERDLLESTPREAALKVLAHFMQVKTDMVWKLVKQGRALFSCETVEKLERAFQEMQHDPSACRFLGCAHPNVL